MPYVQDLARLYTDLQVYKHIKPELREQALLDWWSLHKDRTPELRWNEFAAATGSTLGVFMLFLAASDQHLTDAGLPQYMHRIFHMCAVFIFCWII